MLSKRKTKSCIETPRLSGKSKTFFRITLLLLFIIDYPITIAQIHPPPWQWVKAIGGIYDDVGTSIAVDPVTGDVYTTGYFGGTVDFDPGTGIFNLTSPAYFVDMFISKLDGSGNFLWAKAITASEIGKNGSYGNYIIVDPTGGNAIYITGKYRGTVDFDPGTGIYNLTSTLTECEGLVDCGDNFISKFDGDGNFIWVKTLGGTTDDFITSITVNPSGSGGIYTTGSFRGKMDFNPGSDTFNLISVGLDDIFIFKLDASGNFVWAKAMGGTLDDIGFSIALDPKGSGDVYTTGGFSGQCDFDPGVETLNLYAVGLYDIFISKLDSLGNFVWAKAIGGSGSDDGAGNSIILDPGGSGDIYTTGYFEGTADFDPGKGIVNLTSAGDGDIFISKLDSLGNYIWAKAMGGTYLDRGVSLAFDPKGSGHVYILGSFYQTADFDPDPTEIFNLTSAGSYDIFTTKLDGSGDFQWAKAMGGTYLDRGGSIALNSEGNGIYVTGNFFSPSFHCDSFILPNQDKKHNDPDIFIAKLDFITSIDRFDFITDRINIFPNPAGNELTIEFDEGKFFNVEIRLYTILGEVVFYTPVENTRTEKTIDISALPNAIYFIELTMDGNRVMKKIVKENLQP